MTTTPDDDEVNVNAFLAEYYSDVLDCGHRRAEPTHFHANGIPMTAGYAEMSDGRRVCYACADDLQRGAMVQNTEITAYLSSDGEHITTWTGGELAKVISLGSATTGFGGSEITFVRAVSPDGREWYGRNGGKGMSVRLKAVK